MDKKDGTKRELGFGQLIAFVVAELFFLLWFFVMLDGFGWVME